MVGSHFAHRGKRMGHVSPSSLAEKNIILTYASLDPHFGHSFGCGNADKVSMSSSTMDEGSLDWIIPQTTP
jgi:hypothetical protein